MTKNKIYLIMTGLFFATTLHAEDFKPNYEAKIESNLKELLFNFHSGQVQIRYQPEGKQNEVRCELVPLLKPKSPFKFDEKYEKFRCEITFASELKIKVKGKSGQVQASNISSDTDISIENGQIQFGGNPDQSFKYDVKVEQGMSPMLPMTSQNSSKHPIPIKLHVKNGMISVQ